MKNEPSGQASSRLNEDEKKNPLQVIQQLFDCYHLHELKEQLNNWLQVTLQSPTTMYKSDLEKSNLQFLHESMEKLADAAWLLKEKVPVSNH